MIQTSLQENVCTIALHRPQALNILPGELAWSVLNAFTQPLQTVSAPSCEAAMAAPSEPEPT